MKVRMFLMLLVVYALVVGHFNLLFGVASAVCMLRAYAKRGGRLLNRV